jgi:hypothetical protein
MTRGRPSDLLGACAGRMSRRSMVRRLRRVSLCNDVAASCRWRSVWLAENSAPARICVRTSQPLRSAWTPGNWSQDG